MSTLIDPKMAYAPSLTHYQRRKTVQVDIGGIYCGSDYPIRLQSMTTADTMDTQATVEEAIRMIEAGSEYVRITAPGKKDAENLKNIKAELKKRGYDTPLVADIHFLPTAAEIAARLVEKVRINPGNYVDSKKFKIKEYTDSEYQEEIEKIRKKFIPLVKICKEYGTAMRIGTNHGSLSDRIMSYYGDTPLGMVESALEFIRIAEEQDYHNIVVSMKASNARVMIQAYRLLVQKLDEENLKPYPLHLGVTEAGEAEDGRIKSAVGIGTLLEDGLGDTIRVSLTEPPEAELPVAAMLAQRYETGEGSNQTKPYTRALPFDPFEFEARPTREVRNFGADQFPRVIADLSGLQVKEMSDLESIGHKYLPVLDKWKMSEIGADYLHSGQEPVPFMIANGAREILDQGCTPSDENADSSFFMESLRRFESRAQETTALQFLHSSTDELFTCLENPENQKALKQETVVLVLESKKTNYVQDMRRALVELMDQGIDIPVLVRKDYSYELNEEQLVIDASVDLGGVMVDGLANGIWLGASQWSGAAYAQASRKEKLGKVELYNRLAFGILQAARARMTRTEYISCPSCGRTLFDLPETTAMIRRRTDHLKGVKIGIMGCIVNGPGEMADADYGYVGQGKGTITLYRGQEVVKRGIPSAQALDELIEIIKADGNWTEPGEE